MQKKKRKKIIKREKSKFLIILALLLFICLIALLIIEFKDSLLKRFSTKEPELIIITDHCSVMLNGLLHEIKGEDECKTRCIQQCEIRDKEFYEINYSQEIQSCNNCDCYCK